MDPKVRDRLVLPVLLPLGVLLVIALVTILFALVLLAVPAAVATGIAIGAAVSVLLIFTVLSIRERLSAADAAFMAVVAALPLVLGGAVALGVVEVADEGHGGEEEPTPIELEVIAENIEFDTDRIVVEAGRPLSIAFENKDTAPHNIAIFEGDSPEGEVRFQGEIFPGPETMVYAAGEFEPGQYYFHCDVHPSMNGAFVVEDQEHADEEEPEEPEEPQVPEGTEVLAENIAFDIDSLTFSAGEDITIVFTNRDSAPHNIAIFQGDSPQGEVVFRGEIFQGTETRVYEVGTLNAGNYYFHCDVHPNMSGDLEVG